ncbi:MAG: PAS domain S-box protein [Chloroflexales bacterium]|nr:PAS domain S-box protein [Chloroflexales bacterium]
MDAPPLNGLATLGTDDLIRLLAAHTRDIIFRLRVIPQCGLEYISPACAPITGYPQEAFYADHNLWFSLVHPEDRFLPDDCCQRNGSGPQGRFRWRHRDGHMIWVEQRQRFVFDSDGSILAVEGSIRDVTEYVTAEARLKLLGTAIDAAANAVVITSPQAVIEWVNPAFTSLTGYSAEEAIGQSTRLLRSGRHTPRFYESLWQTVLAGQVWSGELINRRKDGSLYHEEQTITPVLSDRAVTHFIAVKQDVSARVEREREREALLVMTAALRTARTRAEMLPALLGQTLVLLRAAGAALIMRDPLTGEAVCELGVGTWSLITGSRQPGGGGATGQVIGYGRPCRGASAPPDGDIVSPHLPGNHRAVACVPLRAPDAVLGALWIACQYPVDDGDLRLLVGIADMAANAIQRATLFEQTERRLRYLTGLHMIDQAITSSLDPRLSLGVVIEQAILQLGVDAADVLLLNGAERTLDYAAGQGFLGARGPGARSSLDESLPGRVAQERHRLVVGDLREHADFVSRPELIATEGFRAYVAAPLVAQGRMLGVLELFHRAPLAPDREWLDYLDALAGRAAVAVDNAELFGRLQRSHGDLALAYDTTLEGWSRALDLRDKETEGHSQRVTDLTVRLARAMGLSEHEIVHIRRGALLHDIGKMGIPDAILLKPGALSDAEWVIMRRHPVYGYELLAPISYLRPALDIPLCHHEKWDGTGYPRGLAGEDIPLAARLFAVVDVWDALCSDRPYRHAWALESVRGYIIAQTGRHFDPAVVEIFLRLTLE